MSSSTPPLIDLKGQKQFRIISSVFPAIRFFEDLVNPDEMEILWEIENLTNERIRQEVGDIFLVSSEDRITGAGSSVIMAAFTHIGKTSRFGNGTYGVYYAGLAIETAIRETVYHREKFLRATREEAGEIHMQLYQGDLIKPVHDIREDKYSRFHHPEDYSPSQQLGRELRAVKSWGVIYNSVRHQGGNCLAIFRPPAVTRPMLHSHLRYVWNGEKITDVLEAQSIVENVLGSLNYKGSKKTIKDMENGVAKGAEKHVDEERS